MPHLFCCWWHNSDCNAKRNPIKGLDLVIRYPTSVYHIFSEFAECRVSEKVDATINFI